MADDKDNKQPGKDNDRDRERERERDDRPQQPDRRHG